MSEPLEYINALPFNVELDQLQRKVITNKGNNSILDLSLATNYEDIPF